MEYTSEDKAFMGRALALAEKARGFTSPNPMVGAVIVKNGKIVGEGYHKKAGTPHAEINALSMALGKAMGATVYVTLEPCAHYGKTPPCANALVRAGIKEVYIALEDPNPQVNGKGITILKEAGIDVHVGLLREEAIRQNLRFLTNQIENRAYIVLKSAQTIDGKIGPKGGEPVGITGEASLRCCHVLRRNCGAVLVGINTILKDNPTLNIRYGLDKLEDRPVRVILDPHLQLPLYAKVLNRSDGPILIYTADPVSELLRKKIESKGGDIVVLKDAFGGIDLDRLPQDLLQRGIYSVLIEGGAYTLTQFFKNGRWDEYHCFVAPKIGGNEGISLYAEPLKNIEELNVKAVSEVLENDVHITYYNRNGVTQCLRESSKKPESSKISAEKKTALD